MRGWFFALTLGTIATVVAGAEARAGEHLEPRRPVATYSIVARDEASGELGVAVQSHWFQVGTVVAWAEAGVGAVATQSFVETSYGPRGLALLRGGHDASSTLTKLLAEDGGRDTRQVALVDREGRVAAWTGARCIAEAGHVEGKGYSIQANLMEKSTVWGAMARAFEASAGRPLADRLLLALEAAEAEGGDVRGRQSAALVVVRAATSGDPSRDRLVDLRVDDHPQPVMELRRLYGLHRAYAEMNDGDAALAAGRIDDARHHYEAAVGLAPGIVELPFWQAVTLAEAGDIGSAIPILRRVIAREARWRDVLRRLPAAGLLAPERLAAIESALP